MSGKNCVRLMLHRQRSHMTLIHMVPLLTNDSKGGYCKTGYRAKENLDTSLV